MVSYLGLDPRVRQSGDKPAQHGRISKQGPAHARGMLVQAAWAAATTPGPLHAFFVRIQNHKGKQVAAVATARTITVLAWHLLTKQEDYAWGRPALVAEAAANAAEGRPTHDVAAMRQVRLGTTASRHFVNRSDAGLNMQRKPTKGLSQPGKNNQERRRDPPIKTAQNR